MENVSTGKTRWHTLNKVMYFEKNEYTIKNKIFPRLHQKPIGVLVW